MSDTNSEKINERPWGRYDIMSIPKNYQVKILTVYPGGILSLQSHKLRSEHWIILHGTAKVTNGESVEIFNENESVFIPVGNVHRLENPGKGLLEVIEVQIGDYLGEDDITRYEDKYNRELNKI
jgi:mannose-6-phosphate isomerase-like protein (cupin superfamily)